MGKLKLHEAIAVVLLSKEDRKAHIQEIADIINSRQLYQRKDGQPLPDQQVKLRTKLAGGQYHHLFEYLSGDVVKLRDLEPIFTTVKGHQE